MNFEHAHTSTHTLFHCYELYWWCGTCALLLITTFFLLRGRRAHKDAQQLHSSNTELHTRLQEQGAALCKAEQQVTFFQQATENIPDALVLTDPAGKIQYCNTIGLEQTGYTKEELLSQPISLLLPESVTEQQQSDSVIRVKKKDSTNYPASAFVTALHNQEEKISGMLFLLKDQSTLQQREQEHAAEQHKLLTRLSKARRLETIGIMTGEAAHDLNNILAGILHHPEQILSRLSENSPLRPPLVAIRHSGQQAVALVADLLSAAKAGSAVREVIDLNQLVQEILDSKEQQNIFRERAGISLRTRLCPHPLPINCSPPHIRQCLHNLLLNSCDTIHGSGPVGTITVSLDSRYLPVPPPALSSPYTSGEYALLSVADTGPSLSAIDRDHIFEPFYSKKILQRKGTGIALAVLRNIIEEHEGWIDIPEQREQQGNCFDLYFPIRPVQNISRIQESQCILIIEQEKEQRERNVNFLAELGYKALSVADSTGAISYLNRNKVDVVLLNMSGGQAMAGEQLHEQILFLHPSQKVVLISSDRNNSTGSEASQSEKVAVLQPHFNQHELQEALQKLLLN
jgi:PAS domain S-box-containing protein